MAKIGIISLGCPKNTVDSEEMLGCLSDEYEITTDESDADVLIINTCGFIESAKEESVYTILNAIQYKQDKCKAVIVTGCLVQRYGAELAEEIKEVDAFIGLGKANKLSEKILKILNGNKISDLERNDSWWTKNNKRILSTNSWTAYLRIADGCDNRCSYCAIPDIRGRFASRKKADILNEAKCLVDKGVKELNIVAQDITRYGNDLEASYNLHDLLNDISEINGIEWIRLLYCYPTRITDELIDVISYNSRICKYIDIPLQHSANRMLKLMNREGTREEYIELFNRIRQKCPDISLRTSFIVGFPSETGDEFNDLIDFIQTIRFDRAGVFKYSREDGTPASDIKKQVSPKTIDTRYDKLMKMQQKVSLEINRSLIGKTMKVLVESIGDKQIIGRSYRDAPEIDGLIYINKNNCNVSIGSFINAKIIDAKPYDLAAELI